MSDARGEPQTDLLHGVEAIAAHLKMTPLSASKKKLDDVTHNSGGTKVSVGA